MTLQVPKLCHSRPMHVPATYTPPQERAACRFAFALVPTQGPGLGFLWTLSFRRLIGWFTFVLLRASYLTGISPAFSSTVHYPSLENRAAGGGLVAAPVARHRGATPSFRDPSSTVHLCLGTRTPASRPPIPVTRNVSRIAQAGP